jgi:serpin B
MAGVGWFRELFGSREQPSEAPPAGGATSFGEANNEFALAMYGQLREQPGNLLVSPFSIRVALGIALAGARGETAAQMRDALCISSTDEALHAAVSRITRQLNAGGGGHYEMVVANSLWAQNDPPLQPGFLDLIARYYDGRMNVVDFREDAEHARTTINRWVEGKTRQKILALIPPGGLNDETRLVLVNALYFKGTWVLPFERAATRDAPFHLAGGTTVEARLMYQREDIRHMEADGYQAVDLAYKDGGLSMLVLLPNRQDGLRELEESLTERMLDHCIAQLETRKVNLFLPQFKIAGESLDVRAQLAALGMPLAFSQVQADFSGINGLEPPHEDALWISKVFHKTFVEVNEVGTEAAAATAVVMDRIGSAPDNRPRPIALFRADHPFLFAIRDRKSDTILFLGRMTDPTRQD